MLVFKTGVPGSVNISVQSTKNHEMSNDIKFVAMRYISLQSHMCENAKSAENSWCKNVSDNKKSLFNAEKNYQVINRVQKN